MSTDKPVRVALLGCGAIAQAHLRAIAANPGVVEVAGIYDADRSRAEARAAERAARIAWERGLNEARWAADPPPF